MVLFSNPILPKPLRQNLAMANPVSHSPMAGGEGLVLPQVATSPSPPKVEKKRHSFQLTCSGLLLTSNILAFLLQTWNRRSVTLWLTNHFLPTSKHWAKELDNISREGQ